MCVDQNHFFVLWGGLVFLLLSMKEVGQHFSTYALFEWILWQVLWFFITLCFAFSLSLQDGWCDASSDDDYNRLIHFPYGNSAEKIYRERVL